MKPKKNIRGHRELMGVMLGAFLLAAAAHASVAKAATTQPAGEQPATEPAIAPLGPSAESGNRSTTKNTVPPAGSDFTNLSIEDLMNVEVTSVSRQEQKIGDTAAAITVIGQDDIQRSGLNSVPELLRLVPGLEVAQFNANTWSIGSRGMNDDLFANKLLVMSDGRSVNSQLFSGVYWDMQQPMLEDLDRIEVIRGPGATIWGANAVNGVINILSKSSRDTQGYLFSGLQSNYEEQGAARFGGKIDDNTYFRVYGKYQRTDDFPMANGDTGFDGWQNWSSGFRMDHYTGTSDIFTFQGDYVTNREGQILQIPIFTPPFAHPTDELSNDVGYNLLGRWTHVYSDKSDLALQVYYDHIRRTTELNPYRQDTGDIEFHERFPLAQRQEIIWGAEYRFIADDVTPVTLVTASPQSRDDYIASTFVQDDFSLVPDRLHIIVGSKFEDTSYGGFDYQPSARMSWTPNDRNTVWSAVSRAVRTPSRWEQTADVYSAPVVIPPLPVPVEPVAEGDSSFKSETLIAYEAGYRVQPAKTFSVDTSIAYNNYFDLRSYEPGTPTLIAAPPHLVVPVFVGNSLYGETYAAEVAANWQVNERWRLAASYSFLQINIHQREAPSADNASLISLLQHGSPQNQFQLHSYFDVTKNLQLNASMYYVGNLSALAIPSYIRTDFGVTWTPKENLHISFGVQNLFDNEHPEFGGDRTTLATQTEVPRTIYGSLEYHF